MKKLTMAMLAVVLLAGMSSVTFAQGGRGGARGGGGGGGGGGGFGGGRGAIALLVGVSDSAAVAAKVQEIVAKYQEELAPIMQAAGGGGRGRGMMDSATTAKVQEINGKRNAEIRALLTKEDDQKKFDENVAAQAARGRRGGGGQ